MRVEEDTARFWLGPGSLPGGLAARHTEENPFVLTLESGGVAQLGLYAASDAPTRVGDVMTVLVRTEDSGPNPSPNPSPNPTPTPTPTISLTLTPTLTRCAPRTASATSASRAGRGA